MKYSQMVVLWVILVVVVCGMFSSCKKDIVTTNPGDKLALGQDTLTFDTVFTQRGSATRLVKIYNPNSNPIVISQVRLAGGASSPFRMNLDGDAGTSFEEIRVEAQDSMYLFAEVTIDPTDVNNPFVVRDSVLFLTNGNEQKLMLEAWGQNANYVGRPRRISVLDCNFSTWTDSKPYYIFGILIVDGCTLNIGAGVRVHFEGGFVRDTIDEQVVNFQSGILLINSNASLKVQGSRQEPVVFESSRTEEEFDDEAGQWGSILIAAGSQNNEVSFATIRNGTNGFQIDSAATLELANTYIYNASGNGIRASHAQVTARNCLIHDCGVDNLQLIYGGEYRFYFCTFANYSQTVSHREPIVALANYTVVQDALGNQFAFFNDLDAQFENCIIHGSKPEEIALLNGEQPGVAFGFRFDHCLVRLDTTNTDRVEFADCVVSNQTNETLFENYEERDYHLDSLSIATDKGFAGSILLLRDFDGVLRTVPEDIGCYEYVD
jgi:hypothetical protein